MLVGVNSSPYHHTTFCTLLMSVQNAWKIPSEPAAHVGVTTKEAATEPITCVDVLSAHGVRARAQVADDVVQPPIVNVAAQIHAVDPPSGGGGPLKHVCHGERYVPR